MIHEEISDNQWIYCTRKIKRIKRNRQNQNQARSLKKYSGEFFSNVLKTIQFANYNIFSNANVANAGLLINISDTMDKIASIKVDYITEAKSNIQKVIKQNIF